MGARTAESAHFSFVSMVPLADSAVRAPITGIAGTSERIEPCGRFRSVNARKRCAPKSSISSIQMGDQAGLMGTLRHLEAMAHLLASQSPFDFARLSGREKKFLWQFLAAHAAKLVSTAVNDRSAMRAAQRGSGRRYLPGNRRPWIRCLQGLRWLQRRKKLFCLPFVHPIDT